MTIQTRMQKLMQGLSPLQRTVLVLQAQREGRDPDPELCQIADPVQGRAFNRYMGLGFVINRELGYVGQAIAERTDLVENAGYHFQMFSEAAAIAEA